MSETQVPIAIGIDVGGSGIKGAAVDVATGQLAGTRHRVPTPQPSTPQACIAVIARMVKRIVKELPAAASAPVGIGVPSVVVHGHTRSAANIDPGWVDFDADHAFGKALKHDVWLVNDADAAGTAEMRFGVGVGRKGTVIVLTLGTGVGSAIYVDGRLVPNTELGHMEIRGRDAERRSASAARTRRGLSWKAWAEDLDEHLLAINKLFSPDLFILGGGVSKRTDQYVPRLTVPVEIVPAAMRNEAGIVGAALVAADRADRDPSDETPGVTVDGEASAEAGAEPLDGSDPPVAPDAPGEAEAQDGSGAGIGSTPLP
jgi:polyphosphate glucokinase